MKEQKIKEEKISAPKGTMNHRLKSVNVFSAAKIFGLIYASFGLLLGLFLVATGIAYYDNIDGPVQSDTDVLLSTLQLPFFYGFLGVLMGGFGAFIYNIIADLIGGLELEIEQA
jgi:hypothetical protein